MKKGDTSTILEIEAKVEALIKILVEKKVMDEAEFKEVYENTEIEVMKNALKKLDKVKDTDKVEEPAGDKEAIATSIEKLKDKMEEVRLKGEVDKLKKKHNPQ
jgi:NADH dehydrogenase/NADH:ubiquinone oxidoreductase subunit G